MPLARVTPCTAPLAVMARLSPPPSGAVPTPARARAPAAAARANAHTAARTDLRRTVLAWFEREDIMARQIIRTLAVLLGAFLFGSCALFTPLGSTTGVLDHKYALDR